MNNVTANSDLKKASENLSKVFNNLTGEDPMIVRDEVLEQYKVDLKQFFPTKGVNGYEKSEIAVEVREGKLYDLKVEAYSIFPLVANEERKNYRDMQRYLVLHNCDLIFKLFTEVRTLNAKIIFKDNGIWAYKNDSELYSDREMAKRMVNKLEAEKHTLMEARSETIFALQAASIDSNVTAEAMEVLLRELELPKF